MKKDETDEVPYDGERDDVPFAVDGVQDVVDEEDADDATDD